MYRQISGISLIQGHSRVGETIEECRWSCCKKEVSIEIIVHRLCSETWSLKASFISVDLDFSALKIRLQIPVRLDSPK
jgi:hypothetical protein